MNCHQPWLGNTFTMIHWPSIIICRHLVRHHLPPYFIINSPSINHQHSPSRSTIFFKSISCSYESLDYNQLLSSWSTAISHHLNHHKDHKNHHKNHHTNHRAFTSTAAPRRAPWGPPSTNSATSKVDAARATPVWRWRSHVAVKRGNQWVVRCGEMWWGKNMVVDD